MANLQSDSSVPESLGSPSKLGTCGPQRNSQWVISISTRAGTVRRSSVGQVAGESDHNSDGPTQTPRLAADMRLCVHRLDMWYRTHRKWHSR